MAELSASTFTTSEIGQVTAVLEAPAQQDGQPAPAPQEPPKRPTKHYSWRAFEPQPSFEYVTDCERADELLTALQPCAFGFDVEWKPVFLRGQPENKVALIQLANNEVVYLLQVSAMQRFPDSLRNILESEKYTKAGVGIQGDAKKVYRDCGVSMKNCIDLSLLARSVDSRWKGKYINPIGLANLVSAYESLALGKGKITRSNWEAQLSVNQQEYAANDGHSGYTVYSRLIKMADAMVDPPLESCYSFNMHCGSPCDPTGRTWHPNNPNYDPGPPPRPPREKKEQKEKVPRTEGDTSEMLRVPEVPRQPKHTQRARGHHHYQRPDRGRDYRPHGPIEAVSGPSSGQTNGLQWPIGTNGGRGWGYAGPGPIRQPRGGGGVARGDGGRVGTFNKPGQPMRNGRFGAGD